MATETFQTNPEVKFYAISCVPYKPLCHEYDVHGYPKLLIFKQNSVDPIPFRTQAVLNGESTVMREINMSEKDRKRIEENRAYFRSNNNSQQRKKKELEDQQQKQKQIQQLMKGTDMTSILKQKDIYQDASKSFYFTLKNGIFSSMTALDSDQQRAFSDWLHLLSNTLPSEWNILKTTHSLMEHFDAIVQDEDHLIKKVNQYDASERYTWSSSCSKGKAGAGYTCGLWELFHVMSVGMVERNQKLDDIEHRISVKEASMTIRNFVEHFFGCSECVDHFITMYDSCWNDWCETFSEDVSDSSSLHWKDFAIWIWDVHNNVNVRLMKEDAERKDITNTKDDEKKAQWPARSKCETCWNQDDSYNYDAVYEFLKKTYW